MNKLFNKRELEIILDYSVEMIELLQEEKEEYVYNRDRSIQFNESEFEILKDKVANSLNK